MPEGLDLAFQFGDGSCRGRLIENLLLGDFHFIFRSLIQILNIFLIQRWCTRASICPTLVPRFSSSNSRSRLSQASPADASETGRSPRAKRRAAAEEW